MLDLKLAPVRLAAAGYPRQGIPSGLGQTQAPPAAPPSTADVKEGFRKIRSLIPVIGAASVAGVAVSAAAAWVGYSTGKREKGLLSATGYGVMAAGIAGGLGALAALWGTTWAGGAIDRAEQRSLQPPVTAEA